MSDPSIPALALVNDHSAVGIDNQDTYGLQFAIRASEDWVYVPDGASQEYDAQIVIAIRVGDDDEEEDALCASQSTARRITFSRDSAGTVSRGLTAGSSPSLLMPPTRSSARRRRW